MVPSIKRQAANARRGRPVPRETADDSPAGAQLEVFIQKFAPDVACQIREVLARMRAKLPGAVELVYDNYNALAIGFASGERVANVIFSVACYPRWVSLFFWPGVGLDDPHGLLKGSGTRCRHIVLRDPAMLDDPHVSELMRQALAKAGNPIDASAKGRILIKSVSAKQRPRRPPEVGRTAR
jgi:hypothetical protein